SAAGPAPAATAIKSRSTATSRAADAEKGLVVMAPFPGDLALQRPEKPALLDYIIKGGWGFVYWALAYKKRTRIMRINADLRGDLRYYLVNCGSVCRAN